jgi:protease I
MDSFDLSGKKVAVIATDYFEEAELFSPLEALRGAGADVKVIAPHDGEIKGLNHVEPGKAVPVDQTLEDTNPNEFDALVIPGGAVNADHLRMDMKAREFVQVMFAAHRPVAVICHGPWLLVSSGCANGKKLTSYFTIQDDMRNAGAEWVDESVVVDDNLITSRKPDDLPDFNKAILEMLST